MNAHSTEAFASEIRGELEKLETTTHTTVVINDALERLGDALRNGLTIRTARHTWLSAVTNDRLIELARTFVRRINTALVSETLLQGLVETRDRAESFLVGCRRASMPRGIFPDALDAFAGLQQKLDELDQRIGATANAEQVKEALGPRRALLRENDWTWNLPELVAAQAGSDGVDADDMLDALRKIPQVYAALGFPPDRATAAYISQGRFETWIEKVAEHNPDYRDLLLSCIEDCLQAKEHVEPRVIRWAESNGMQSPRAQRPGKVVRFRPITVLAATGWVAAACFVGLFVYERRSLAPMAIRPPEKFVAEPDETGARTSAVHDRLAPLIYLFDPKQEPPAHLPHQARVKPGQTVDVRYTQVDSHRYLTIVARDADRATHRLRGPTKLEKAGPEGKSLSVMLPRTLPPGELTLYGIFTRGSPDDPPEPIHVVLEVERP